MKTFLTYAWLWTLVILVHLVAFIFCTVTLIARYMAAGAAWVGKLTLDWLDALDDRKRDLARRT